jgi:F0F1-type ATP synthase gamma subunit
MGSLKTIKHQQQFADQLYGLVDITQSIAVMRMQQVRQSVLVTRTYMEGIIDIFKEIRRSHKKEVEKIIAARGKVSQVGVTKKRRDSICILLSPSGKFSGQLIRKVFSDFAAYVKETKCDVAVVGNTGKELLAQSLELDVQPQYYALDLEHPTREEIAVLLFHVLEYENITVFTGKFQSLVTQVPTAYNVTGYETLFQQEASTTPEAHEFLFEPKLTEIISFFVAQVTATLLRETLEESKLANLGSRIITLESSRGGIGQEISKLQRVSRRLKRRVDGRKQSNRLCSMRFWK